MTLREHCFCPKSKLAVMVVLLANKGVVQVFPGYGTVYCHSLPFHILLILHGYINVPACRNFSCLLCMDYLDRNVSNRVCVMSVVFVELVKLVLNVRRVHSRNI